MSRSDLGGTHASPIVRGIIVGAVLMLLVLGFLALGIYIFGLDEQPNKPLWVTLTIGVKNLIPPYVFWGGFITAGIIIYYWLFH